MKKEFGTEKFSSPFYFSDDQEPPSLNNQRYSNQSNNNSIFKSDFAEQKYQPSATNYRRDKIYDRTANSRQIYSNNLNKQPKSQTNINCYQDVNPAVYSSAEKTK